MIDQHQASSDDDAPTHASEDAWDLRLAHHPRRVTRVANLSSATLARMEHGVLGEARTRALLAERFWILERSVDVEGADFLIQRRLTSLRDREPPRLGYVQAKFVQDARTTIYVDPSYVRDGGRPHAEFFLSVHSGVGDEAAQWLLTASEIAEHFATAPEGHKHAGKFVLPGRTLLAAKFRVTSVTTALDRIEQLLRLADMANNRRFVLQATPFYAKVSKDDIAPEFLVPLDNDWGDIPTAFFKFKTEARRGLHNVEEVAGLLRSIVSSTNPEEALAVAEELSGSWGQNVSFGNRLFDDDFLRIVRTHREQHDLLREHGLLDAFLLLRKQVTRLGVGHVLAWTADTDSTQVVHLRLRYDWTDLAFRELVAERAPRPTGLRQRPFGWDEELLVESVPGDVTVLWPAFDVLRGLDPQEIEARLATSLRDGPLMGEILRHLTGPPVVAEPSK